MTAFTARVRNENGTDIRSRLSLLQNGNQNQMFCLVMVRREKPQKRRLVMAIHSVKCGAPDVRQ